MSRSRVAGVAVAAVLVLLFGGRWVAIRFTEAAWYADLGLAHQYWLLLWRGLFWQLATLVAATVWYALHTFGVYRSIGAVHLPRRVGDLEIDEAVPRPMLRAVAVAIAVVLGIVTAATFADLDDLIALYRHATSLDLPEPILGRDASFYLARLPLFETLHLMATIAVVMAAILVVGLYMLTGSVRIARRRLTITPHARTHLAVLAAVLALVVAWGFQLGAYGIVGGGGSMAGALSPTDRSVRIPVSTALAALGLVVSAITVLWLRWGRAGVLIAVWATYATAAVLGRFVAPYVSEAWGVPPDAGVALAFAGYADRYSRAGLGLLEVRPEDFPAEPTVAAESVAALGAALDGISPWSVEPGLLDAALTAAFPDTERARVWTTTVDRYRALGGTPRLVALAVAETDGLAATRGARRPGWTDLHRGRLAWASEPVAIDARARGGAPELTFLASLNPVREDSTRVPSPLHLAPGRIRFLSHAAELGIEGPDAMVPSEPPPGPRLGGVVRRLLLAWALQSPPLLGSRTSGADRVLYWRDVPRRLAKLYGFASFDRPQAVLAGGRLVWVADGYVASGRFPLAQHVEWRGERVNFLRAPYIATVDAVSGLTRLYLRPPTLPLAADLARGAAAIALPADSMAEDLRQQLAYPADLFLAQASMLARHHDDAQPGAKVWVPATHVPAGAGGRNASAPELSLVVLAPLGETSAELWRLLSLSDAAGNRLVALVAGTARGDGSLRLRLLRLPELEFPTPAAVDGRFSAAPALAAWTAAATGPEGAARRSPVLAVPAAGTVAYAQVLFASARRAAEPLKVRGVAVMVGGRVAVGPDFPDAARALLTAEAAVTGEAPAAAALAQARAAFAALDSAAHRGDWAEFGRALEALRRALTPLGETRP